MTRACKPYTTKELQFIRESAPFMSTREIAVKLEGRTPGSVCQAARRSGISFGRGPYQSHTNKEAARVLWLRQQGRSYREISRETGIPLASCMNLFRRSR